MATPKLQERPTGLNGQGAVVGMCVLLVVAVWLVFGQTLRHQFLNYDDAQYFSSNPQVQAGLTWSGVVWAFGTTYAANWHPLTWLSLMLDVQLFGAGPMEPHLTNVLLHAANTVLLFILLRRLTGAHWRSAMVAALFAIHPLHVESVAWVSERKDVLSGVFFMLTLLAYARYVQGVTSDMYQVIRTNTILSPVTRHPSRFYWLALLFFALGLMSKPMLVTLPFVLLLLDYWPLRRLELSTRQRLILEKLPFLALSAGSCLVTLFAQRDAIVTIDKLPVAVRACNAALSGVAYLGQMVYPARLAVLYRYSTDVFIGEAILALAFMAAISAGVFALRRTRPYLLVGWLWYWGMLVPVIGLVQVGRQTQADRYTYLPLIGVFIMLVWGIRDLFSAGRHHRPMLGSAAFIVLTALMVCASIQTSYWRNSESLWKHTLACTSGNDIAHINLANALARQDRYVEAVAQFRQALEINPHSAEAHNSFGIMLARQGQLAEAIQHFQQALESNPAFAEGHENMGNALAAQGRGAEAIRQYQRALELKPDSANTHFNLGNLLARQGRYTEAIGHFQRVLQLRPNDRKAHDNLDAAMALQSQATGGDGIR